MKNKIIIIEDSKRDYEFIKRHISSEYDTYPMFKDDDDFNDFRGFIAASFNGGINEDENRNNINKKIMNDLGSISFNKDTANIIFIIDYQLKDESPDIAINGWKFYEEFVRQYEIPTLFISRMLKYKKDIKDREQQSEQNDLLILIDNENDRIGKNILTFLHKEENWEISSDFCKKIKDVLNKLIEKKTALISPDIYSENISPIPAVR